MHLGVILPNYDRHASPAGVRAVVEAAEGLGYDSVWATEHIIVGPDAVDPYGRVLDPFCTLSWIAGYAERVSVGTSIVIAPLHNPLRLAKEAATLQDLSGGRFLLGLGAGWYEEEFRMMGVPFAGRGRRMDEATRLMRALWSGAGEFHGENWSFEDATADPLPSPPPEIWIGGASDRSVRRARELGDVWHPVAAAPDRVREIRARFPDLRVVPRVRGTSPEAVAATTDALLADGCEGVVVSFGNEPGAIVEALPRFVERVR